MRLYPSTKTRILRARELGIRSAMLGKWTFQNPYVGYGSGRALRFAWDVGHTLAQPHSVLADYDPRAFGLIDLSAEMSEWYDELEAELPAAWPRSEAVA